MSGGSLRRCQICDAFSCSCAKEDPIAEVGKMVVPPELAFMSPQFRLGHAAAREEAAREIKRLRAALERIG